MPIAERVLKQAKGLVRAVEVLETIEATGPFERAITWLQLQAYRRRLRAIVAAAPSWVAEEIVSVSQHIDEGRPAVWLSEN